MQRGLTKRISAARQVVLLKIQIRPEQFGPDILGDDPWIRGTQQRKRTGEAEGLPGIDAAGNKLPQQQIGKETAQSAEMEKSG